jgi:hypothetical protein
MLIYSDLTSSAPSVKQLNNGLFIHALVHRIIYAAIIPEKYGSQSYTDLK